MEKNELKTDEVFLGDLVQAIESREEMGKLGKMCNWKSYGA